MSTVVAPAAACRPSAACRPPGVPPLIFTCLSSPGTKHIIYLTHTHEKTLIIFGLSLLSLHFVFLLLHIAHKANRFLDMYILHILEFFRILRQPCTLLVTPV